LAGPVIFLAGEASKYVNGDILLVEGPDVKITGRICGAARLIFQAKG